MVEFWNVFTRPKNRNGLGLTAAEADHEASLIEQRFTLLPENDLIHPVWRQLVVTTGVSGVQVHDARLVAAMRVHGVNHLLTLNGADFVRFANITVTDPSDLTEP